MCTSICPPQIEPVLLGEVVVEIEMQERDRPVVIASRAFQNASFS